ncbi:MAG: aminotransferase class III-fold pyridoxal phosphate-dependent enzyme, partial [Arenicellales bacterium]
MASESRELDSKVIREMDTYQVHPWEAFGEPPAKKTIIGAGEGAYVWDAKGRRLLDGPGGMWCVNAGHGRQEIVDAMNDQAMQLSYTSPWSHSTEPAARLAKRLASV